MKSWIKKLIEKRLNVSFSRSGDDIQLMRLLQNASPGCYVDIGAWHPVKASNSYYFYLRGWRGICIDPNPELADLYRATRPTDEFINMAVGLESSTLQYYMLLSGYDSMNTLDGDFIRRYGLADKVKRVVDVPTRPLWEILDERLTPSDRLDFFDVDAEGYDLEILQSNDWDRFRPSIVVTETEASLKVDLDSEVSQFLDDKGYRLVGKTTIKGDLGNLFYIQK